MRDPNRLAKCMDGSLKGNPIGKGFTAILDDWSVFGTIHPNPPAGLILIQDISIVPEGIHLKVGLCLQQTCLPGEIHIGKGEVVLGKVTTTANFSHLGLAKEPLQNQEHKEGQVPLSR